MKKLALTLATVAALTSVSTLSAATLKVGVINLQKILAAAPQAKKAEAKFKDEFAPREAKLKASAQTFQQAAQTFERNASVMSDKQKQAETKKLTDERAQLQQTQTQFSHDAQAAQAAMMKEVFAGVKTSVNKVAVKNGYDLVLQSTTVAYFKDKFDMTQQVIDALK
jgi:outer membrane protein